ncbi:unnamed protein product [Malus baccata var. baccata]
MTTPHGTTQQFRDDVLDEGTPGSGQEAIEDLTQLIQAHVCATPGREKSLYGEFRTHKPSSFDGIAEGPLTWEQFQTAFFEQYFPESFRDELEVEFATVEQGTDTVADYVAHFTRLYHFSQPLPKDKKTKKLIRGFKPSIRNLLSVQGLPFYAQAIDRAYTAEINEGRDARESGEQIKRGRSKGQSSDAFFGRFRKCQGFSFGGSQGSLHIGYQDTPRGDFQATSRGSSQHSTGMSHQGCF